MTAGVVVVGVGQRLCQETSGQSTPAINLRPSDDAWPRGREGTADGKNPCSRCGEANVRVLSRAADAVPRGGEACPPGGGGFVAVARQRLLENRLVASSAVRKQSPSDPFAFHFRISTPLRGCRPRPEKPIRNPLPFTACPRADQERPPARSDTFLCSLAFPSFCCGFFFFFYIFQAKRNEGIASVAEPYGFEDEKMFETFAPLGDGYNPTNERFMAYFRFEKANLGRSNVWA